jgi:hypothetical protein
MSSRNVYNRSSVPAGESIILEAKFLDSAGNPKDTSVFPSVEILDVGMNTVRSLSDSGVTRTACGHYRLEYLVPSGHAEGLWNDRWVGTIDGYEVENVFDFTVYSVGSVEVTGSSVPEIEYTLDDDDLNQMARFVLCYLTINLICFCA